MFPTNKFIPHALSYMYIIVYIIVHFMYVLRICFSDYIYIYIYFKKLEITRSNKLLAIYRLNSGRDNDLGQVKLETCYIHVLSRYLSCEFLTTQTCLLKYKLARTGNILKNWKRKYIYIFYHQFQIYLN